MGERYLVSGVQLGMLVATPSQEERQKIVDKIIDDQFLDNSKNTLEKDFERLKRLLEE